MVTIHEVGWDDPAGSRLRQAQRTELDARYGNDDHEPGQAPSADNITLFLVARDASDLAVGCGGLRLLDDGTAEIKRMYVTPGSRGTGTATAILRALEVHARRLGLSRLLLETGTMQPDAIRFYEREGYTRIPNFGAYEKSDVSVCYQLSLEGQSV